MNASPPLETLRPPRETGDRPPRRWLSAVGELVFGKVATLVLTTLALGLGVATFVIMARGSPFGLQPGLGVTLVLSNLSLLLLLGAVLAVRLTRVWVDRRRGSAGSQLHVRLVMLCS